MICIKTALSILENMLLLSLINCWKFCFEMSLVRFGNFHTDIHLNATMYKHYTYVTYKEGIYIEYHTYFIHTLYMHLTYEIRCVPKMVFKLWDTKVLTKHVWFKHKPHWIEISYEKYKWYTYSMFNNFFIILLQLYKIKISYVS